MPGLVVRATYHHSATLEDLLKRTMGDWPICRGAVLHHPNLCLYDFEELGSEQSRERGESYDYC